MAEKNPDSTLKYVVTGFVFAIATFTDPTYYAVILLGAETNSFLLTTLLITIWFLISQSSTVIVYIANQLNLLNRLVIFIDRMKSKKNIKVIKNIFYIILIVIAILFMLDSLVYLFFGHYLF